MENQRDDLIIIFAGYKERMDSFYESNPGLSSRVANHVDFPDYSAEELLYIAKMMLAEQQYRLTPDSETVLLDYIACSCVVSYIIIHYSITPYFILCYDMLL